MKSLSLIYVKIKSKKVSFAYVIVGAKVILQYFLEVASVL